MPDKSNQKASLKSGKEHPLPFNRRSLLAGIRSGPANSQIEPAMA
jgi:hypothetical protein